MPTFLQLRVTNLCNLRCKMCGQWGDTGVFREHKGDGASDGETERARIRELIGLRRQLALEDYERLLDEVAPHQPIVSLFGGEPFLYPDILPLVRAIKTRGLVATVITNGWHLERHARELVEAGMDSIAVSIDGPPDVHDRIRGRESSFARAAAGIRAVAHWREKLGRGLPVQMAILPVTELNAADVPAALDALRALPLELVNVGLRWFVPPAAGRSYERVMGRLSESTALPGAASSSPGRRARPPTARCRGWSRSWGRRAAGGSSTCTAASPGSPSCPRSRPPRFPRTSTSRAGRSGTTSAPWRGTSRKWSPTATCASAETSPTT
jgi:pyruvate-formate lyase-activating enzyme